MRSSGSSLPGSSYHQNGDGGVACRGASKHAKSCDSGPLGHSGRRQLDRGSLADTEQNLTKVDPRKGRKDYFVGRRPATSRPPMADRPNVHGSSQTHTDQMPPPSHGPDRASRHARTQVDPRNTKEIQEIQRKSKKPYANRSREARRLPLAWQPAKPPHHPSQAERKALPRLPRPAVPRNRAPDSTAAR